jgi:hypothetical protein
MFIKNIANWIMLKMEYKMQKAIMEENDIYSKKKKSKKKT